MLVSMMKLSIAVAAGLLPFFQLHLFGFISNRYRYRFVKPIPIPIIGIGIGYTDLADYRSIPRQVKYSPQECSEYVCASKSYIHILQSYICDTKISQLFGQKLNLFVVEHCFLSSRHYFAALPLSILVF